MSTTGRARAASSRCATSANAAPDGYTIILSSESNHILLPLLGKNFPLDVAKDFVPISLSGQFQHTLIVKKETPVATVQELVSYLSAHPGKLSFGSSGVGTQAHIAGEYLSLLTESKMVHVPYRSSPAALNDLLAGNLDVNFQSMPAVRLYRQPADQDPRRAQRQAAAGIARHRRP